MKSLSKRLLALLSAATLILAVSACDKPATDTNTPGATPDSLPSSSPENTPPTESAPEPGDQPADEAGGGPVDDLNQPETQPGEATDPTGSGPTDDLNQPETQPQAQPVDDSTEPTGGGPTGTTVSPTATPPTNAPGATTTDTSDTEPTGGGPTITPGAEQPQSADSEMTVEERLQRSRDKINDGLNEMRSVAAEQAAQGDIKSKRAAEELQNEANKAEKSIESGLEKLKQEMQQPETSP